MGGRSDALKNGITIVTDIIKECNELIAIFVTSVKTAETSA
jgi:hypothetical protein